MPKKKKPKINVKKMSTNRSVKTLNKKSKKYDSDSSDSEVKKKVVRSKASSKINSDDCVVCSKLYESSNQDWFQCKLCSGWGHESCGIKGKFHFFCKKCF